MPRIKRGVITHKRHKKVLSRAKGYWGGRSRLYKTANEAVAHSLQYAYRDRRNKKREFRELWIARINAACRLNGISYSRMMNGLRRMKAAMDRKVLADIAVTDSKAFAKLVEAAKA